MSVVPSDSASRVGESDSAVGGAGLCISPPSDVFMTTMGDAAAKYMDKYFAAYQSYCRTTQMLSNGAGSVVATSMSSAGDVSVGGSECSSRSSGSGVCSSSSATRSVASSVGVGLSSRMSRRGIRNFTRQMRSKGVTSALPGGYCYVRAMRSEAREQAALALGAYPALGDLLARPREEFMPLSSTQHLSLKLDGTVAHVGYCESSSDPSYNKAVVEFAKRTEYEFGTYGSDLRRAHSLSYLSGDFSELKLTTPIGGPDPGPKADLASNEKFIDTLTGVLSKYCSVKSLSRATEESLRVVWSSHAHGSWSSDRMLMLRDIGRSVIRNFSIGSVLRKRGRRSDVAVECSRMSDLNVLAGYYDFLFPRTLGYYGTVRKSLIVCDILGSLQFSGSAGVSVKLFECLRSLGTTVPLDVVVSPSGIATSLVSLFHVPGYCYLQLFQPLVRQRIVNLLGSWPAVDQLLRCDVADFHSVESMSYFSVGVGAERCHLTLSGDGTSLFDVMASLSKASVYGPGTLGAAFSRVDGAPADPLCSSAMRVGGRDPHVGRLSMHHADLLARATGVSASGVVTPVVQVRQLNLYDYRVAVVYGSGVALAFALDFGDRSVKAFMPVPYVPDESKVFSYVKASADSGTRDATWYTFDGLDGRVVPYPTSSSVDAFDCLLWNAQKFVYSDGPWGRTVNMPYASFLRYHGL